jgi:hypothetical protein
MLSEFALMPNLFDEEAHPDRDAWEQEIRSLAHGLFPGRGYPTSVILANLWSGEWENDVRRRIARIKVSSVRLLSQTLLTKFREIMIPRPRVAGKCPDDVEGWGREALESSNQIPLPKIFSCKQISQRLGEIQVKPFSELASDDLWEELRPTRTVAMDIEDQIKILENLLRRVEFIWLFNPHITGDNSDETRFAKELIRVAFERPQGFRLPEIEIHTMPRDSRATSDLPKRLDGNMEHVAQALSPATADYAKRVRILFHKRLLDRYLVAGMLTRNEDDVLIPVPKWVISLGHVARPSDSRNPQLAPTTWSLLGKRDSVKILENLAGPQAGRNVLLERRLG